MIKDSCYQVSLGLVQTSNFSCIFGSTRIINFGSLIHTSNVPNSISAKRKPVNFPVVHLTEQNEHSSMDQQISVIFSIS